MFFGRCRPEKHPDDHPDVLKKIEISLDLHPQTLSTLRALQVHAAKPGDVLKLTVM